MCWDATSLTAYPKTFDILHEAKIISELQKGIFFSDQVYFLVFQKYNCFLNKKNSCPIA